MPFDKLCCVRNYKRLKLQFFAISAKGLDFLCRYVFLQLRGHSCQNAGNADVNNPKKDNNAAANCVGSRMAAKIFRMKTKQWFGENVSFIAAHYYKVKSHNSHLPSTMKKFTLYIIVCVSVIACQTKPKTENPKIMVFCAASLTNVISEIAANFEKENNIELQLNFASSGTLARQIEHGAAPALFISANKKWVSYLNEIGKIVPGLDTKIAGNSLVVVAPLRSDLDSFSFSESADFPSLFKGRLSVGDPKHVPAGEYAMQPIEKMGFKTALVNRLLPAKDVRSALMVVELGETEAGIVYKTDALESKKVKIVAEIPERFHAPIGYFVSVLINRDENAMLFYAYLNSETSKDVWLKHGFEIE